MKHASAASLDRLDGLRQIPQLRKNTRGVFHVRSRAYLHLHEDAAGLFADLRRSEGWERYPVGSAAEQSVLLRLVEPSLAPGTGSPRQASSARPSRSGQA